MSIQAQFDNQAIDKLRLIKEALINANSHDANKIRLMSLRAMGNSSVAVDDMSYSQLVHFQNRLLRSFKNLGITHKVEFHKKWGVDNAFLFESFEPCH